MVCGTWVAVLGGKPPPGAKVTSFHNYIFIEQVLVYYKSIIFTLKLLCLSDLYVTFQVS